MPSPPLQGTGAPKRQITVTTTTDGEIESMASDPDATGPTPLPDPPAVDTFEHAYHRHFADLVRLATMITGSTAAAEDVVQDAFAKLYLRFDRVEHPGAYLRRSVLNGCTSRFRRHRRERLVDEHPDEPDEVPEPSDRMDLARRLDALPPRQRAVVVLRVHVGLPEAEVAEVLGCRPGTVGSLLHRALAALRIDLQRTEETSP
jgi:RNA polymerase sigma-70 factor (sigma-E family)